METVARMFTTFTCDGRMRLNDSHEMPPNASGVTNSVASTSPKRSTIVSQMIAERIQCFAAVSGNGEGPRARSVSGAGACAEATRESAGGRRPSVSSPIPAATVRRLLRMRQPDDELVTRASPWRHVGLRYGAAFGQADADPDHRGRTTDPRVPQARPRGGRVLGGYRAGRRGGAAVRAAESARPRAARSAAPRP